MPGRKLFWALLALHCWTLGSAAGEDVSQVSDLASSFTWVGAVDRTGGRNKLQVYELDGTQFAEPSVNFGKFCWSLKYNYMYSKHQLSIPIRVDANPLKAPLNKSKKLAQVQIRDVKVTLNDALKAKESGLSAIVSMTKSGEAELQILCDTFVRCRRLRDEVVSNPWELTGAVRFDLLGQVQRFQFRAAGIRSNNAPSINCRDWIVFQRRVDGRISFAQTWDAYEKGFGDPSSNYWMGLESLFAITVTDSTGGTARCQMKIDATDHNGKRYHVQYDKFQVLGPDDKYKLRLGGERPGATISAGYSDNRPFSTYDRDHDAHSQHCSRIADGYGGWWIGACTQVNPNGAYWGAVSHAETYAGIFGSYGHLSVKSITMMLKCA